MPLNDNDVRTGIGGMMLEIWNLQKQVKELQVDMEQLKKKLEEYKETKKVSK